MADLLTKIKQYIPGTEENQDLRRSSDLAREIMEQWSEGEEVYSQIRDRVTSNRDFYLGTNSQQFNSTTLEGDLRIVTNVGAAVLDLMTYMLSNNAPTIQVSPVTTGKVDQVEASIAEGLIKKAFRHANFHQTFRDTCKMLIAFAGFALWYPFWNADKKFGKVKNHFDFTLLNPLTTRVFYEDTDYKRVAYFLTMKRMLPSIIYELYDGFVAAPDAENVFLPREIQGLGIEDGKVSVFKRYDEKYVTTVIDNRVAEEREHGLDFTPLIQTNNLWIINDAHGREDLYRMLPVAQELNMLLSAASEIARDLAWPPLLEYNGALGGKKIAKMRGVKIPVRRTDKGEALEFLTNKAQIGPLLEQIRVLLDLFHFVALMPKAAAGIFDSTVTSGFQARVAMQPATLASENKKIDLEVSIIELARTALYLIEKNDPEALKINENTRLKDLHQLDLDIVWPDNLPIDIAREIQNLILGIQNNVTSVTQAIDKYNVLMGMGSTEDTLDYLRQEAEDASINPDRALKIAQVQQALAQVDQAAASIREKLGGGILPPAMTEEEQSENPTNFQRAATSPLPEERKPVPATAREAVAPESTGGKVITP